MKTKFFLSVVGILFAVVISLTSCDIFDDEDNNDNSNCEGIISATATGYLTEDYCFTNLGEYTFKSGDRVIISAGNIDSVFCMVEVGTDSLPYTGPGTYKCGGNEAGYVELIYHTGNGEFYKPDSGSVTITSANSESINATFDVYLTGYYNKESINLKGTVKY